MLADIEFYSYGELFPSPEQFESQNINNSLYEYAICAEEQLRCSVNLISKIYRAPYWITRTETKKLHCGWYGGATAAAAAAPQLKTVTERARAHITQWWNEGKT